MARTKKKKHSSGLYRKSITIGHKPDGTPIRQYVYGETITDCDSQIAQLRIDKNMGVVITDKRSTWDYWADTWKAIKYKQIGKSSQTMYDCSLKHLKRLNGRSISDLTPMDIVAVISEMEENGYSKQTIKITLSVASQICTMARQNRAMMLNIMEGIEAPKNAPEKQRRALSVKEQEAIWNVKPMDFNNKSDAYRAERLPLARMLALMTLCCGLRRGETIALYWSNVDLVNRSITVDRSYDFKSQKEKDPKTSAGFRKVPIPQKYINELIVWKKTKPNTMLVFQGNKGIISESEHERLWDTLLDAINHITISERISSSRTKNKPVEVVTREIEFTSHNLRHTFATNAAAKGVDVKTLQYIMGHEKAETLLDIYAHFSQEAWNAAAEKLDNDTALESDKKEVGDMVET